MLTLLRFLLWSAVLSVLAAPALTADAVAAEETASPGAEIPLLSEVEQPTTSVVEWGRQIQQRGAAHQTAQALVQITNVSIEPSAAGVEVVLETAGGELAAPTPQVVGNALIVDIANATIAENVEQIEPIAGIALIEVTGLPGNRVRVAITGADAPPAAAVTANPQQLILSATVGDGSGAIAPDDAIEVITTATRTEEALEDVPRSVTVITREEIEQQSRLTRNLGDILSQLLPGFSAPNGRTNTFGQTLRGREFSVLIDGVPQNTNLGSIPAALTSIDPEAIERIEVLRGPNAVYGGQATGGLINIITRRPEEAITNTIVVGVNAAAGGGESFLLGDSFGYSLLYSLSGTTGNFDWLGSLSYAPTGRFYDAEGDRIPSDLVNADTEELNGLVRLGVDLSETQRLQFVFNHFRQVQDSDVISDPEIDSIPGIQEARAIDVPDESRVIGAPENASLITTNLTLQYLNDDLLNSQLQGQIYYRSYDFLGGRPSDLRDFFGIISQSPGGSEQWGGRLQIDTPFDAEETVSLLWGVDYVRENSSQRFNLFDPEEFDESGGLIFRKIDEVDFVPPYELSDLGLFAQLQWQVFDRLILSGGTRYVNLNITTDDYTTFDGNDIEGGTISADAFVFNAGLVFEVTNEISAFASFSQGFSLPDIGRVLRSAPPGFAVEADVNLTEPQQVDNYEVGLRGSWETLQASIAGFYNFSSLGTDFAATTAGPLRTIRAPQRVYGIEATINWQPSDRWTVGGTAAWLEGENDEDRDGEYLALNSITIPPFKLTTYIENETLPGWRNRLQLLYSGSRDRAFNDAIDGAAIDSYVTLDLLSSIRIGEGELQIGIQNLLNEEYYPVFSQYFGPFADSLNRPGRGRTLSLNYRVSF